MFQSVAVKAGSCTAPAVGKAGTVVCALASSAASRSWEISIKVKVTAPNGSTITIVRPLPLNPFAYSGPRS